MAVAAETCEPAVTTLTWSHPMRSLLLLFLGIPIPIIILIALFVH